MGVKRGQDGIVRYCVLPEMLASCRQLLPLCAAQLYLPSQTHHPINDRAKDDSRDEPERNDITSRTCNEVC